MVETDTVAPGPTTHLLQHQELDICASHSNVIVYAENSNHSKIKYY